MPSFRAIRYTVVLSLAAYLLIFHGRIDMAFFLLAVAGLMVFADFGHGARRLSHHKDSTFNASLRSHLFSWVDKRRGKISRRESSAEKAVRDRQNMAGGRYSAGEHQVPNDQNRS